MLKSIDFKILWSCSTFSSFPPRLALFRILNDNNEQGGKGLKVEHDREILKSMDFIHIVINLKIFTHCGSNFPYNAECESKWIGSMWQQLLSQWEGKWKMKSTIQTLIYLNYRCNMAINSSLLVTIVMVIMLFHPKLQFCIGMSTTFSCEKTKTKIDNIPNIELAMRGKWPIETQVPGGQINPSQ